MSAELYGYFSDGELNPPDTNVEPITECDECNAELYDGDSVFHVYIDEPLIFCSKDCLLSNIGATEDELVSGEYYE